MLVSPSCSRGATREHEGQIAGKDQHWVSTQLKTLEFVVHFDYEKQAFNLPAAFIKDQFQKISKSIGFFTSEAWTAHFHSILQGLIEKREFKLIESCLKILDEAHFRRIFRSFKPGETPLLMLLLEAGASEDLLNLCPHPDYTIAMLALDAAGQFIPAEQGEEGINGDESIQNRALVQLKKLLEDECGALKRVLGSDVKLEKLNIFITPVKPGVSSVVRSAFSALALLRDFKLLDQYLSYIQDGRTQDAYNHPFTTSLYGDYPWEWTNCYNYTNEEMMQYLEVLVNRNVLRYTFGGGVYVPIWLRSIKAARDAHVECNYERLMEGFAKAYSKVFLDETLAKIKAGELIYDLDYLKEKLSEYNEYGLNNYYILPNFIMPKCEPAKPLHLENCCSDKLISQKRPVSHSLKLVPYNQGGQPPAMAESREDSVSQDLMPYNEDSLETNTAPQLTLHPVQVAIFSKSQKIKLLAVGLMVLAATVLMEFRTTMFAASASTGVASMVTAYAIGAFLCLAALAMAAEKYWPKTLKSSFAQSPAAKVRVFVTPLPKTVASNAVPIPALTDGAGFGAVPEPDLIASAP